METYGSSFQISSATMPQFHEYYTRVQSMSSSISRNGIILSVDGLVFPSRRCMNGCRPAHLRCIEIMYWLGGGDEVED
jgi:hypothetical protein